MRSKIAITKLQTILFIDLLIVAFAATGFFYVSSLPGPSLAQSQVQLVGLTVDPPYAFLGQSVIVSVNVTNIGTEIGTYAVNLILDNNLNQNKSIKLAIAETKTENFSIINTPEGTHIVTIGNLEGTFVVTSKFVFSDLAVNRTEAKIGEPIGISVQITNKAQENGEYSATLYINGETIQTKSGQLDGGASTDLLFEVVEQTEGTYNLRIGSLNGTLTITSSAPPPKPAQFQVTDLIIDPEIAQPGAIVNITAKITNAGEVNGYYSINFSVNGEVKDSKTGQLSGGETTNLMFTLIQAAKGTYIIKVGNVTGTLNIQDPSKIKLTNLVVKPYEVWAGQKVTIIAKGINAGTQASALPLKLKIDGTFVESKTLQLEAGAEGSVEFTVTADPLKGGDSLTHIVDVNEMQGGFMVVKNGFHTMNVQITPRGDAKFKITLTNGVIEEHTTFWSALLPEGTYTVTMPATDPTGRITFQNWDDGSTNLAYTFALTTRTTVTATYVGGTSCPSLYMWNGTGYEYVSDVSNHGWLGYINYLNEDGSITYYRNNPWDYTPLNSDQLKSTNGNYNLTLIQRWNEIFYLDQAYLIAVDHPANVDVYSTMVEQYLDPNYMGKIYTVSKNPITPISAANEKGENILPQISKIDENFTSGGNGIQSPTWNNITWNRITLNLGNLRGAQQIKLVVRAIVNWGSPDDYTTWLDKFFAQPVPNGTQITPPPFMEVKDANGNWVRIPESRQIPLPPDGVARTYVVDLTGLFPTNDYSLRINNFWNVTYDYIAVDTMSQQNITIQKINPQADLYQAFAAGETAASGNFTRYGDVTQLVLNSDDEFAIGRQGDAVSLQFATNSLKAPAVGMVRDYFFVDSCWFKDENGNWGFGFGFTVDPLPFTNMTGFPYPPNENYPNDTTHQNYQQQWNTRTIQP